MKKSVKVILSVIVIAIILFGAIYAYSAGNSIKDTQAEVDLLNQKISNMSGEQNQVKINVNKILNQLKDITSEEDESTDEDDIDIILDQILDKLDALKSIESTNQDKIEVLEKEMKNQEKMLYLEKELIKQASGAYDDYTSYYHEEGNDSYSVRFPKEYMYEIEDPVPGGVDHDGMPGELRIFLNKNTDEQLALVPWHSRGVSTTMKDSPVYNIYTDEGESIEYVYYEADDGYVRMDVGFSEHFLKVYVRFKAENKSEYIGAIYDIIRSIMFYDFNFED